MSYIGRFAPSPTGPLHFGSLLAALASFLDARASEGRWLLRIEDLDPPREQAELKDHFPEVLEAFGLYWDGELSFQSERHPYYRDVLDQLIQHKLAYPCGCSRTQIQQRTGSSHYDGHCLQHAPLNTAQCAIRLHCSPGEISFIDRIQGEQHFNLQQDSGDYVLFRRDGLFAYQLAVVVDDFLQGITHVVRGCDLLTETPKQIQLQRSMNYPTPSYAHIPVASNALGQKLSKQTAAPALDQAHPVPQLYAALIHLDQNPPADLLHASTEELIDWAISHWQPKKIQSVGSKTWPETP